LLTFLVLLSAVFAQKLITSPQSKHIFLLSLANTALVYTHNIGLFWVFAQFLAISLVTLIQKNTPAFQKLLLASLITGILYLPWSGVTLSQTREATTNFWIENTQDKIEYEGIFTFNEVIFNENVSLKPQPYTDFIRLSKYLSILGVVVVVITFSLINPRIKTFFSFFLRFKELSHRLKFYWRDPSSIPIAAVLSLGITVFSINFFSWYITPLTYPRYFAFLNPFALLCIFFAFVFLRNFSRPILLLFLAGYLYLSGLIAHDYFKSSPVNYSIIANFSNVPIYSPEVLDIMPCVFYHPECRYVGNTKDTSRYIGVSSLPNIPSITSWHEVQEDKIIVLYKDYNHDEVLADLKAVGFEPVSSHVLGDHSILGWFVRDQKLSSGIK
jgi:hypothetical protein